MGGGAPPGGGQGPAPGSKRGDRSRSPRGAAKGKDAAPDPVAKHVCHREVPHFKVVPGQLLGPGKRYYVRRLLGEGTFGRVLSCVDVQKKEAVAVKVVKGVRKYCEYAEAEGEALREIMRCDPGQQSRCVRLLDSFLHPPNHFCLVFERLGVSVHEFMQKGCTKGLLVANVQTVAQQLLQCLCFLHGLGLSHTDLKCRNVMFRDPRYEVKPLPRAKGVEVRRPNCGDIVVIDFGGALFAAEKDDSKIGTRHYRAPEVIAGLPWDEKVDVWAAGCLVALTYLGFRPVGAAEDLEQLALMERLLGREVPRPMGREALAKGKDHVGKELFHKSGRIDWPERAPDQEAVDRVAAAAPLREQIASQHGGLQRLLEGMLQLDPKRRLSAEAASDLPFALEGHVCPE